MQILSRNHSLARLHETLHNLPSIKKIIHFSRIYNIIYKCITILILKQHLSSTLSALNGEWESENLYFPHTLNTTNTTALKQSESQSRLHDYQKLPITN